jgi:hypothetical protein
VIPTARIPAFYHSPRPSAPIPRPAWQVPGWAFLHRASTPTPPASTRPFKSALVAYLNDFPSVASLLAADPAGLPCIAQQHPGEQDGYPSLAYRVTTRSPGLTHDGDAGYADATVEFTARAQTPDEADAIVLAISALFHGKFSYDLAGVPVLWSAVDEDSDDYDTADDASDDGTFSDTISIDFSYRTR